MYASVRKKHFVYTKKIYSSPSTTVDMFSIGAQICIGAIFALIICNIGHYRILLAYGLKSEPCPFYDTINITDGYQLVNGSYTHENVTFPPHLYGKYNYIFNGANEKQQVEPHLRGCLCYIKNCTRLCCRAGHAWALDKRECIDMQINETFYSINISTSAGNDQEINLFEIFGVTIGLPCYKGDDHFYESKGMDIDQWKVLANGDMQVEFTGGESMIYTKDKYCFALQPAEDVERKWALEAFFCLSELISPSDQNFQYIQGTAGLLSIPFMIITILIYTIIPELRNLHGKCLCCHLICVITYSSAFAYMRFKLLVTASVLCTVLAYISYYNVLAAFFWLNIVSYDLWSNFRVTKLASSSKKTKRFWFYSLYSWGMPIAFTTIATILDNIPSLPDTFKVGFANEGSCFIAVERWIQLLYLYGPTALIIVANAVMFGLIAVKIYNVQKEMNRIMASRESQKNLEKEKARDGLYLKLFLVMGVSWTMEIVAWLAGDGVKWFFIVTDVCNALMGVMIFFLFVFKKNVWQLIMKRYRSARGLSDVLPSDRARSANSTTASLL